MDNIFVVSVRLPLSGKPRAEGSLIWCVKYVHQDDILSNLVELGLRFRLMAEYFGRFGKHIVYVGTKEKTFTEPKFASHLN